jgi:hypothetical protein
METLQQFDLRFGYAERRRRKSFKNAPRIIWKSKSKIVA